MTQTIGAELQQVNNIVEVPQLSNGHVGQVAVGVVGEVLKHQDALRSTLNTTFINHAVVDNPLRISNTANADNVFEYQLEDVPNPTMAEKKPSPINIPHCLTKIGSRHLKNIEIPEGYEPIIVNLETENEFINAARADLMKYSSSAAETQNISVEKYVERLEAFYLKNQGALDTYVEQILKYHECPKPHAIYKEPKSHAGFLVHIGLPHQAVGYQPKLKEYMQNNNDVLELYRVLGMTPTFHMATHHVELPNGMETTCDTLCVPLIPQFAAGEGGRYRDGVRAAAIEGAQASAFIWGNGVIGLGGMLTASSEGGIASEISIGTVKVALLHAAMRGEIDLSKVKKHLPYLFEARVTTGHVGTIWSMTKTLELFIDQMRNDDKINVCVLGTGYIGGSFAKITSQLHKDRVGTVYLVDKDTAKANKLAKELQEQGITVEVCSTEEYIDRGLSAHTDIFAIATNASTYLDEGADAIPGFAEAMMDLGSKRPRRKSGRLRRGDKLKACVISDNHPDAISPGLTERLLEARIMATQVGIAIDGRIEDVLGSTYRLDKPETADGRDILYGCHAEAIVDSMTGGSGYIDTATPEKVLEFDKKVKEQLGGSMHAQFHNNGRILTIKAG